MKQGKLTKLQQCRQIFCDLLNEDNLTRKMAIAEFIRITDISATCAATYYQTIRREMNV